MSDRSEEYVTLVQARTLGLAANIRDMLHAGGIREVNVWPVPILGPWSSSIYGPHVVTVPQGSFGEAQRLLRESGLVDM